MIHIVTLIEGNYNVESVEQEDLETFVAKHKDSLIHYIKDNIWVTKKPIQLQTHEDLLPQTFPFNSRIWAKKPPEKNYHTFNDATLRNLINTANAPTAIKEQYKKEGLNVTVRNYTNGLSAYLNWQANNLITQAKDIGELLKAPANYEKYLKGIFTEMPTKTTHEVDGAILNGIQSLLEEATDNKKPHDFIKHAELTSLPGHNQTLKEVYEFLSDNPKLLNIIITRDNEFFGKCLEKIERAIEINEEDYILKNSKKLTETSDNIHVFPSQGAIEALRQLTLSTSDVVQRADLLAAAKKIALACCSVYLIAEFVGALSIKKNNPKAILAGPPHQETKTMLFTIGCIMANRLENLKTLLKKHFSTFSKIATSTQKSTKYPHLLETGVLSDLTHLSPLDQLFKELLNVSYRRTFIHYTIKPATSSDKQKVSVTLKSHTPEDNETLYLLNCSSEAFALPSEEYKTKEPGLLADIGCDPVREQCVNHRPNSY